MNTALMHRNMRSSTLLEVLVGMTIIMITMSIVFPLIVKTQHESQVIVRNNAIMTGNSIIEQSKQHKDISEFVKQYAQFELHKTVEKHEVYEHIRKVNVTIKNKAQLELFNQDCYIELE